MLSLLSGCLPPGCDEYVGLPRGDGSAAIPFGVQCGDSIGLFLLRFGLNVHSRSSFSSEERMVGDAVLRLRGACAEEGREERFLLMLGRKVL